MATTTNGQLYFVIIKTLERLNIQFIPDVLHWNRTVKEGDIIIVGRNNPVEHYITGTDTISFKLTLHALEESRADVIKRAKWIKSLTYNNGYNSARPRIRLVWGDMFNKEVWVVKSVDLDFRLFDKVNGMLPTLAGVDVVLQLDPSKNLTINDVR